jgi:hypothetical protein
MPHISLRDTLEAARVKIGASLLELQELDTRRREARTRLFAAYMELGEAMRSLGPDSVEDVA